MKKVYLTFIIGFFLLSLMVPNVSKGYWECEYLFGTCVLNQSTYTCQPGQFNEIEQTNCAPITDPGICEGTFSDDCPTPTPFPDNCWQCQTGGNCAEIPNSFPGNPCNNVISEYDTYSQCSAVCGNNYACNPNNYTCEIQDENTPPEWQYWGGPNAQNICDLNCIPPAPPEACIGVDSKLPGQCQFFYCRDGFTTDGKKPPSLTSCPPLYNCCIPNADYEAYLEKDPLGPTTGCTTSTQIKTAIGCIETNDSTLFSSFWLKFAIGIGGGMTLVLSALSGILWLLSGGDPEKVKAAKELLGGALGGLLMIIFSVYLLELIGVRILQLPGF